MAGPMSRKPGGNIAYAYAQDPENGQSPRRLARRLLTRRAKIIISVSLGIIVFFLLYDVPSSPSLTLRPRPTDIADRIPGVGDIWDDQGAEEPKGWGGWGLPFGGGKTKPTPTTSQRPASYIAPQHPDLSLLPDAKEVFADISIPGSLKAPTVSPFPHTRLREVVDPSPLRRDDEGSKWGLSDTSFNRQWTPPKEWNGPRGEIRRVQWEGFAGGRDRWENAEQRKVREERKEAVRRGFGFAWQAYKDHAWGECGCATREHSLTSRAR